MSVARRLFRTCCISCLVSPLAGVMGSIKEQSRRSFTAVVPLQTSDFNPWMCVDWTPSCWSDLLPISCLLSVNSPHMFGAGYLSHWVWSVSLQGSSSCMFQLVLESSFHHIQLLSSSVQLIPLISSLNFLTFALFELNLFGVWRQTVLEIQA